MLVKAAGTGDWVPNSCRHIVRMERSGNDARGLYAVLGVDPLASDSEVRAAAKRRMLETHPDAGGSPEEFMEVHEAYDVLSDRASRARYDVEAPPAKKAAGRGFSIAVSVAVPKRAARAKVEPEPPAWLKEPSDLLSDEDVARVGTWREMLLDAFWGIGLCAPVEVGISSRVPPGAYARDGSAAVIGVGTVPDENHARAFALLMVVENNEG